MNQRWLLNAIYQYLEQGGEPVAESIVRHVQQLKHPTARLPTHTLSSAVCKIMSEIEEKPAKKKKKMTIGGQIVSNVTFADVAGAEGLMPDIEKLILFPIRHPEVYSELRIEPTRGVLFCGPPGTGKTFLASAICGELNVAFYKVAGTELVSGISGETEQKVRDLFKQAFNAAPSILFIDEIDAITPNRNNAAKDMERRIVSQLISCFDELGSFLAHKQLVIVLAATNRVDSIDPALRMPGRFDREINFGIPTESQRCAVLSQLVARVKTRGHIDVQGLARRTPGYVCADLHSVIKEAGNTAIARLIADPTQELYIEPGDFTVALQQVQPSAKREGFTTIPETT